MTRWSSLFWWSSQSDDCHHHITAHLTTQGFTIYDPFVGASGRVYAQTVKCFFAPTETGRVRILIEASDDDCQSLARTLSQWGACCYARLTAQSADCWVFPQDSPPQQLDLQSSGKPLTTRKVGAVAIDHLPDDVQKMAEHLPQKQIESLYQRVMRGFQAVLPTGQAFFDSFPDWHSPQAQALSAYLDAQWGQGWRDPDFVTVRSAYLLQAQAPYNLLAGDQATLDRVPNINTYQSIYGGK